MDHRGCLTGLRTRLWAGVDSIGYVSVEARPERSAKPCASITPAPEQEDGFRGGIADAERDG